MEYRHTMRLEPVFPKEEYDRKFSDVNIPRCEKNVNCWNYVPNKYGSCIRGRENMSSCFWDKKDEWKIRYEDRNRQHCEFEGNCYNYNPNIVGACMSGFQDVLECLVPLDEMKQDENKQQENQ